MNNWRMKDGYLIAWTDDDTRAVNTSRLVYMVRVGRKNLTRLRGIMPEDIVDVATGLYKR